MHVAASRSDRIAVLLRLLVLLLVAILAGPGCTRHFFRERADKDVAGVLTEKNVFPDWRIQNFSVYPDPRARYADPSNPDRPQYPADDYAARVMAPNPQAPTKRSGAGVYEGTGYLSFLSDWDSKNRATDPGDMPDPFPKKNSAAKPPTGQAPAPTEKLPPPQSLLPVPKGTLASAKKTLGSQPRAGLAPPTLTEIHETPVIVASGEIPDGKGFTPVVMMVPVPKQPPERLPDLTQNDSKPVEAKKATSPDEPKIAKPSTDPDPVALVATGPAATDILKALISDKSGFRINMEQSVELAILNSREFQSQREFLYEAALPVTLARFNLAAQSFFTEAATFDFAGRLLGKVPQNSATASTSPSLSKLFPSGALLAVKLANSVVVDLSNGRPTTTLSNFSVNLSQPFLQGGGYAVTLEPLTQAERNLVYAIRSFARFRKIFYVAIAGGGNYTNNPYGFPGLSQNLGRSIGSNFTAPDTGYLPCLLAAAVLANQRRNIDYLENLLKLYRAFREGGQQSDLQVAQVESQLVNSQGQLLGSTTPTTAGGVSNVGVGNGVRAFLDAIDSFKLQLGVPITVGVDLDQSQLRPIRQQLARFESVYDQSQELEVQARRFNPADPVAQFRPRWRQLLTESSLVKGTAFAKTIVGRWAEWEKLNADQLLKRLADLAEERRKLLDRRADRQLRGAAEPQDEVIKLNELEEGLDLGIFEQAVRGYEAQPWLKDKGRLRDTAQAAAFRDVYNAFSQLILEGRNERLTVIRGQWPKMPAVMVGGVNVADVPLDDAYTAAIRAALTRRLDLMSARGQVVDSWRQIKVTANALQGVFTLGYNLSSNTPTGGSNPVAFSGPLTDQQLVVSAELPLVRRAERNNYRTALISYQVQRRTLQAFEDNIANDVRADVRALRTLTELYKVQQRLVELGYFQVDNAQSLLLAPPALGADQNNAATQAALTNQVLNAQSGLVTAQNTLFTIWINYIIARMDFFGDTDLMELDERGIWLNEYVPGSTDATGPGPANARGERLPPPQPGAAPGGGK